MTAEDWSHDEAAREETADAAGLTVGEMAARRALPLPRRTGEGWPGAWEGVVNETEEGTADD